MMHVCLLNDSFPPVIDGVANVVVNYAKIMTDENLAQVLVGTPRYPNTDYEAYPYRVVPYQSVNTSKFVNGYRTGNPLVAGELKEIDDWRPDLIHTHCPVVSTYIARQLRTRNEAPIVFTYHTKFDVDIARAVKAKMLQKESVHALVTNIEACDEVWVVSEGAGENLKSLGYEGEYRVVSNGVDFPRGRVDEEKVAEVTADYDLPKELPTFLFVGRMINYKGLPIILDALSRLHRDGVDFRMIFVGSGPDLEASRKKAEALGLNSENGASKCVFVGAVSDREQLRAWNSRADLFLFPSGYDTNGIVVREAAACGLASVLIQGSCAAEGVTDRRNGFLIQENAESMYLLLKELAGQQARMHEAGEKAMEEIYISWEDSVHAAYERYQVIIENKKAGRYHTKRHKFAGNLMLLTDDLLLETRALLDMPMRLFDNMLDNVDEFGFRESREERGEFRKSLTENYEALHEESVRQRRKVFEDVWESFHVRTLK